MTNFCSLHNHSNGSLLDAISSIEDLVKKAKNLGMSALALTDHHNVFNAIPFYKECQKQGIRPVLGAELNFVESAKESREHKERKVYHLTILAENNVGWNNLIKLLTISNSPDYFYFKPKIDFSLLEQYKDGLVILSGCNGGPITWALEDHVDNDGNVKQQGSSFKAEAFVRRFLAFLDSEHFFIEVQDQFATQTKNSLREISTKYKLRTVGTINSHYLEESHQIAHNTLMQISDFMYNKTSYSNFSNNNFSFRSGSDLDLLPAELEITNEIANRCEVIIDLKKYRLPKYQFVPENFSSSQDYFKSLVKTGIQWRNIKWSEIYQSRLDKEFSDISKLGFVDYFLIVWDVCNWCRQNNILLGPGRGSSSGSIVSYLLGITNIDPLKYDLIWERFLNVGRVGLPDIDTDVPRNKRKEVLNYIKARFGEDKVTQIATYGTLGARQVLKDVFRVFDVSFEEANLVTSYLPKKNEDHAAITISEALEASSELRQYRNNHQSWFSVAETLEGSYKSLGTHASAVVIADEPFHEAPYPLCRIPSTDNLVFAWDMKTVDSLNLLKHDILGLKTLDIISDTFGLIHKRHNIELNLDNLCLDNELAFSLISQGRTGSIFQLESKLGRDWAIKVVPLSVNEVADLVSLIRPMTLDTGLTQQYVNNKFNNDESEFIHEKLINILKPTYNVLVYQEQCMQICSDIAGFSLQESDSIRKVIGKKLVDKVKDYKDRFIEGCINYSGLSQEHAEKIWSWLEKGAGYSFNRSHAIAYALIAYYTAYLKANYTVEFFCSCLRHTDNLEEIRDIINDAKQFNIEVIAPKLLLKNNDFDIDNNNRIVFGLSSIKQIGAAALNKCLGVHFQTFDDLLFSGVLNKKTFEALICSGALDNYGSRIQMLAKHTLFENLTKKEKKLIDSLSYLNHNNWVKNLEIISSEDELDNIKKPNKNRRAKIQGILAEFYSSDPFDDKLQNILWEREYLGLPITGHETSIFNIKRDNLKDIQNGFSRKLKCVAKINKVHFHTIKKNKKVMAFLTAEDQSAQVDNILIFPEVLSLHKKDIEEGVILELFGEISDKGGFVVNKLKRLR